MKSSQEPSEGVSHSCASRSVRQWFAWQPGDNVPRSRVSCSRCSSDDWHRHTDRKLRCQLWKPALLVGDQGFSERSARKPDGEIGSEAPHLVVPPGRDALKRKVSEVRCLLGEQRTDHCCVDLKLR